MSGDKDSKRAKVCVRRSLVETILVACIVVDSNLQSGMSKGDERSSRI